jgi:ribosomal protein L40E
MPYSLVAAIYYHWNFIALFIGYIITMPILPVILISGFSCLVEVAFVMAPLLIFLGFFNWKPYSWYILMFLSISNVVCFPFAILSIKEYEELASMLVRLSSTLLDVVIIPYYWKRRKLFNIKLFAGKKTAGETTQKEKQEYMYCIYCGNKLPPNSVFCNKCGRRVSAKE